MMLICSVTMSPFFPLVEHLEHDVEVVAEILHLRTLVRVHDVFHNEPVQSEAFSELFEHGNVMDAVHVDPGDGGFVPVGDAGFDRGQFCLLKFASS